MLGIDRWKLEKIENLALIKVSKISIDAEKLLTCQRVENCALDGFQGQFLSFE